MDPQSVLKVLAQTLGLSLSEPQMRSFKDYPGIGYTGGNLYSAGQKKAQQILGPLGPIAYRLLFGKQFQRTNYIAKKLNQTFFNQGATPLGSALSIRSRRLANYAEQTYQAAQESLKKSFLQKWATVFTGDADKAKDYNWFSPASLVHTFLDPDKTRQTLQFMNLATANVVNWQNRLGGFRNIKGGFQASQQNVKKMSQAVKKVIAQAAAQQLGPDSAAKPKDKESGWNKFGGYSAQEVAKLAAIVTSQRDFMSGASNATARTAAVGQFQQTISDISKALAPLRDVFKGDVLATVDAIKSVSKRAISSMSAMQLEQLSTSMTDTLRFTGISPAAYAQIADVMTKRLLQTAQQAPGSHWAAAQGSVGVTNLVANSSIGANPAGLSQDVYVHKSQQIAARAQLSQYTQRMARAYTAAKLKKQNEKLTYTQFIDATGGNLSKAMSEYGLSNQDLRNASQSSTYLQALQSGAFAQTAAQQQWINQAVTAISTVSGNRGVKEDLLNLFTDRSKASTVYSLFSAPDDKSQIKVLTNYFKQQGLSKETAETKAKEAAAIFNQARSGDYGDVFITKGMQYAQATKALVMQKYQADLRKYFSTVRSNTNPVAQFVKLISNWNNVDNNDPLKKAVGGILQNLGLQNEDLKGMLGTIKDGKVRYTIEGRAFGNIMLGKADAQATKNFVAAVQRRKAVGDYAETLDKIADKDRDKAKQYFKLLSDQDTSNDDQAKKGLANLKIKGLSDDEIKNLKTKNYKAFLTYMQEPSVKETAIKTLIDPKLNQLLNSDDAAKVESGKRALEHIEKGLEGNKSIAQLNKQAMIIGFRQHSSAFKAISSNDIDDDKAKFSFAKKLGDKYTGDVGKAVRAYVEAKTDTKTDNDKEAQKTLRDALEGAGLNKTQIDQVVAGAKTVEKQVMRDIATGGTKVSMQNLMSNLIKKLQQFIGTGTKLLQLIPVPEGNKSQPQPQSQPVATK